MNRKNIKNYINDKEIAFASQVLALRLAEIKLSSYKEDPLINLALKRLNDRVNELKEKFKVEKRKILFFDEVRNNAILMITDAPIEELKDLCRFINDFNGKTDIIEQYFKDFEKDWYAKILFNSKNEPYFIYGEYENDIDIIGYDEAYNLSDYLAEREGRCSMGNMYESNIAPNM